MHHTRPTFSGQHELVTKDGKEYLISEIRSPSFGWCAIRMDGLNSDSLRDRSRFSSKRFHETISVDSPNQRWIAETYVGSGRDHENGWMSSRVGDSAIDLYQFDLLGEAPVKKTHIDFGFSITNASRCVLVGEQIVKQMDDRLL